MTIRPLLLLALPALAACGPARETPEPVVREILFGSCLNVSDHPMLDRTLTLPMDLFIFTGDNIYADTLDMAVMRRRYDALKKSRFFRGLRERVPILATWDDHDMGGNDAGRDYPRRVESQREFLDWLDEPADSPRRRREGVYDARTFGPEGRRIQVILLDTRSFRSPLVRGVHAVVPSGGPYVPDASPEAAVLGEAQWRWLEGELRRPAEVRLIVSSIQFAADHHGGESWANFPAERRRMLEVLRSTRAGGVLFISGDRHWCELSRIPGPLGYPLYDLTASAMTQKHPRGTPTPNSARFLPATWHDVNVGRLRIDWDRPDPGLRLEILDVDGRIRLDHAFPLSDLRPRP
ncbi:MAG TPA: alkaline phosphatase D family protein [Planctomycetota bacterium]|nr:alkaline phosphatase D family protein [Planctomycetota bacterium]